MVKMDQFLRVGVASTALLGLVACGGDKAAEVAAAPAVDGLECVTLPEGMYVFENGKFSATIMPQQSRAPEQVTRASAGWVGDIEDAFSAAGYTWLDFVARENIGVVTGVAPDEDTKRRALEAATTAIMADPTGGTEINLVVDGISVAEGEPGPGASVAALARGGISQDACQQALNETMEGQKIQFPTNRGDISPVSMGLLDAVAGIAMLCDDFTVEVGSHTDSRGSDEYNLVLSQKRADAVKHYLEEKGVSTEQLTAVGYGEGVPLDTADNAEAWGRNSRTEFKISRQP
ncbi:OmpA family protein [Hyphomonas oceanitis]|uniref:OmpA family protein n=1 Tax=Hyphomonas oceanitis TaxID=81033 RepID=UPI003001575F